MKSDERIYTPCPVSYSSSIFLINSDFSVNLQPVLCRKSEQMMINWSCRYWSINLSFRATFGKGLINVQWVPVCNVWVLQGQRQNHPFQWRNPEYESEVRSRVCWVRWKQVHLKSFQSDLHKACSLSNNIWRATKTVNSCNSSETGVPLSLDKIITNEESHVCGEERMEFIRRAATVHIPDKEEPAEWGFCLFLCLLERSYSKINTENWKIVYSDELW